VNADYGERTEPPDYHAELADVEFHPIAVLKIVACYEYQSCEHFDSRLSFTEIRRSSAAFGWCHRLRRAAVACLPEHLTVDVRIPPGECVPGYRASSLWKATPWGVQALADIPCADRDTGIIAAPLCAGFAADILIGPHHVPGDGISARARHVTIVKIVTADSADTDQGADTDDGGERGLPYFARLTAPSADAPAVFLRFEDGRFVARPLAALAGAPYSASGAFVHSGTGRWRDLVGHDLPIPLHDRVDATTPPGAAPDRATGVADPISDSKDV
jgi:hypothetical protein